MLTAGFASSIIPNRRTYIRRQSVVVGADGPLRAAFRAPRRSADAVVASWCASLPRGGRSSSKNGQRELSILALVGGRMIIRCPVADPAAFDGDTANTGGMPPTAALATGTADEIKQA
jgi:hypothetical protein